MSYLIALSISTGICCGIWAFISSISALHLVTWIGFSGCTAYFASVKHEIEGISTAFFSTMSGVVSALIAVFIIDEFPGIPAISILMTGIISCTMCLKSLAKPLWFILEAFIECFSTFAYLSSGANLFSFDLVTHILSSSLGTILALLRDKGEELVFKLFEKEEVEKMNKIVDGNH